MCGIAGYFGRYPFQENAHQTLKSMISQLRHRGPDGFGVYQKNGTGLAHARLSIIDLSGGAQPIHNEDKTIWTVFNGEIFNYIELRELLEKEGHVFYTNTDTEVIVHLYEFVGIDFVLMLNGQFSIALWDENKEEGFLIRDNVGIQPLFYASTGKTIYFGSEIKSLLAVPSLRKGLDHESIAEVFTYWTTLPFNTVFKDIFEIPQGHYLHYHKNGNCKVKEYWDHIYVNRDFQFIDEDEASEEAISLLKDSVKIRLRSDVPVGAYLSGGLDSTINAALIKELTDAELHTFSIEFDDKTFDESSYQHQASEYLTGINHTSFTCSRDNIAFVLPQVIYHTEKPILRTAPVPMYLLSKLVRQKGYKVVLTGEGADEVFGGYDIFRENYVRTLYAKNPELDMDELFKNLYPWMGNRLSNSSAYLKSFFDVGVDSDTPWFSHIPRWNTTRKTHRFFSEQMNAIADRCIDYSDVPHITKAGSLQRAQYLEFHTLFAGYLISSQGDRMLMANGVEGRFPFLDPRVIEFGNELNPYLKLNGMNEKFILKHAFKGKIPENIRSRSKQPYMAPDGSSFFRDGGCLDIINDVISPDNLQLAGYFDPKKVNILKKKFEKGIATGFPENMAMVGIVSTMFLHDTFVENLVMQPTAEESEFLVNHRG